MTILLKENSLGYKSNLNFLCQKSHIIALSDIHLPLHTIMKVFHSLFALIRKRRKKIIKKKRNSYYPENLLLPFYNKESLSITIIWTTAWNFASSRLLQKANKSMAQSLHAVALFLYGKVFLYVGIGRYPHEILPECIKQNFVLLWSKHTHT